MEYDIYIIINKINNKKYIGQAVKHTGKINKKWGTIGRWKSHIREAFGSVKDHCTLLNNAIRKYGVQSFEIKTLIECSKEEVDILERKLIQEYDTLVPNGYNLNYGGANGKDSDITREKKRVVSINRDKNYSEMSKKQIGNRRNVKNRKYPEDHQLPKYIKCVRNKNVKIGYAVYRFPVGIEEKKYINKHFCNKKNPEECLEKALSYLKNLKEEYKYVEQHFKNI